MQAARHAFSALDRSGYDAKSQIPSWGRLLLAGGRIDGMDTQAQLNRSANVAPQAGRIGSRIERWWFAASVISSVIFVAGAVGGRLWLFELANHFRLQLAVAMLVLAVGLIWSPRRRWRLAFLLITAWAVWSVASIWIPTAQPPAGQTTLRIMSANVLNVNLHFAEFEQLVADVDPDVLVVIEYTNRWDARIPNIKSRFTYSESSPRNHGFGIAVFSKQPLDHLHEFLLAERVDAPSFSFEHTLDGRNLTITAVHTLSPLSYIRFVARNEQLRNLSSRIRATKGSQIVVGDFNSTTWSPYMRDFVTTSGLQDSRQGLGLQCSWPAFCWPMMIAIDQAFVSPDVHIHRRWVERYVGSDHWPIVLDVSISPAAMQPDDRSN